MYETVKLHSYKELLVWQRSIALARDVYAYTSQLPQSEKYGLASQMQRAVVSIPSNIAEGYDRNNRKEFLQFLGIALGSSAELETQLLISHLVYVGISQNHISQTLVEVRKMLQSLIAKLKTQ